MGKYSTKNRAKSGKKSKGIATHGYRGSNATFRPKMEASWEERLAMSNTADGVEYSREDDLNEEAPGSRGLGGVLDVTGFDLGTKKENETRTCAFKCNLGGEFKI